MTPAAGMRAADMIAEPVEILEDPYAPDYGNGFPTAMPMAPMPMAPSAGVPLGGGFASGGEWSAPAAPPLPPERPIIRPPVGTSPALRGRPTSSMPRTLSAPDELGVEESEFDKPTYLRRGIVATE
jgi:hypothetical protein